MGRKGRGKKSFAIPIGPRALTFYITRDLKMGKRQRLRQRRLKSEFAIFQSSLRLAQLAYDLPEAESLRALDEFRKRKKISLLLVFVLHKT